MKGFIKNSCLFIGVLLLLFIIFDSITSKILKDKSDFQLNGDPEAIIVGHSRPECAFNDDIISNFLNIAESGEAYLYTYAKLREVIAQNDQINTIFLEFGNNQITNRMDSWMWGKEFMLKMYPKYSHLMSLSDRAVLLKNNPIDFVSVFSLDCKKRVTRFFESDYDYSDEIGGYRDLMRDKTDSLVNVYKDKSYFNRNHKSQLVSEVHLGYLNKIVALAQENDIQIILVRSPLHMKMHDHPNEVQYQQILIDYFSNLTYLDFQKFPLNNFEFGDFGHLNYKGAKVFSTWLEEALNDGLLHMEDKQAFIDAEIVRLSS